MAALMGVKLAEMKAYCSDSLKEDWSVVCLVEQMAVKLDWKPVAMLVAM